MRRNSCQTDGKMNTVIPALMPYQGNWYADYAVTTMAHVPGIALTGYGNAVRRPRRDAHAIMPIFMITLSKSNSKK